MRSESSSAVLAAALLFSGCPPRSGAPAKAAITEGFVDIADADKTIIVDVRYATAENFTRTVLYPANRCLLRAQVARRLILVQEDLRARGLGLKVWDCYRPLTIQKKLWALIPDPRYVADPAKGSRHNRGAAVDVTLVDPDGAELEMPTAYDDFSERAHRDYAGATERAKENRALLEAAMTAGGFSGLRTEWWHFDAAAWREYGISDASLDRAAP